MPRPVIMPIANDKRRRPERTEAIRILKPAISNNPKIVSAMVAAHANDTADELGKRDVTTPVYCTKRAKFPQDTFFAPYGPHKPKRSATADRKEAPSANRANRRTISVPFSLSCAAFEFIHAFTQGMPLYFSILVYCSVFVQEIHALTTQSDPLLLPTRNGPCREDGSLHWEYLF